MTSGWFFLSTLIWDFLLDDVSVMWMYSISMRWDSETACVVCLSCSSFEIHFVRAFNTSPMWTKFMLVIFFKFNILCWTSLLAVLIHCLPINVIAYLYNYFKQPSWNGHLIYPSHIHSISSSLSKKIFPPATLLKQHCMSFTASIVWLLLQCQMIM